MTQRGGRTDSDLARLRREGLDHLNRLCSGAATDRDAAAFLMWRHQSRAHEEAFRAALRLRECVRMVETGRHGGEAASASVLPFKPPLRAPSLSRRQMLGGALAASVAGAALVGARTLDILPTAEEALADYRTGPGERRVLRLAEDATVDLNTRTSIDLRPGTAMPAVELISGEAVLTSGPAGAAALVAGPGTSVVRGGRFNARREGDDVCITCLAGGVEVAWKGEKRALRPADALRYSSRAVGDTTSGADPEVLTAWQSGTLIFRNLPMRHVVDEINRYRAGMVFMTNPALASRRMSGSYYIDRIEEFFKQIELAVGAKVAHYPASIVVLS